MTPADNEKMRDIRSELIRLFDSWTEIAVNYPSSDYAAWLTSQFRACLIAFGVEGK